MADELARRSLGADMCDHVIRDRDRLSGRPHQRAKRIIVGQLIGHRFESADLGKRLAAQRDRRAEARSGKAELEPDQHVGQEVIVDRSGAEPRPDAGSGCTAIEACHEADARLRQSGDDVREIIGPDDDVAVGHDQHLMSRLARHVDQVRDLAVFAVAPRIDHQRQIAAGKIGDKFVDDIDSRVGRIVDAEYDLDRAWIILRAKAGEIGVEVRLQSVQRLENSDRRDSRRPARRPGGQSCARPTRRKAHNRSRSRPPHSKRTTPKRRCWRKNAYTLTLARPSRSKTI